MGTQRFEFTAPHFGKATGVRRKRVGWPKLRCRRALIIEGNRNVRLSVDAIVSRIEFAELTIQATTRRKNLTKVTGDSRLKPFQRLTAPRELHWLIRNRIGPA